LDSIEHEDWEEGAVDSEERGSEEVSVSEEIRIVDASEPARAQKSPTSSISGTLRETPSPTNTESTLAVDSIPAFDKACAQTSELEVANPLSSPASGGDAQQSPISDGFGDILDSLPGVQLGLGIATSPRHLKYDPLSTSCSVQSQATIKAALVSASAVVSSLLASPSA